METMRKKKQVFLPGEIKCLMIQLLSAISHLHDNWILHRDLKSSNLLLSHNGILKVSQVILLYLVVTNQEEANLSFYIKSTRIFNITILFIDRLEILVSLANMALLSKSTPQQLLLFGIARRNFYQESKNTQLQQTFGPVDVYLESCCL